MYHTVCEDATGMMSPIHLRMARAAFNWTVRELADRAGVNKNVVSRYEGGKEIVSSSLRSLEEVFAKEGVVFFEDDREHGTGVGLKKRQRSK
jgi:transcriptional regulator with XRE-family HTH domain